MDKTVSMFVLHLIFTCYADKRVDLPYITTVWSGGNHSEGPHWSTRENALYWVDIANQNVHRLDPNNGNVTSRHIEYGPVSAVVPIAGAPGKLVIGVRTEVFALDWNAPAEVRDDAMRLITALDLGHPDNRMNDGKVDARGRFWIGSMGPEVNEQVDMDKGTLYMLTAQNYVHPEPKVRPVSVSNGIAWTANNKYMFYIDTPTRRVDVFDYDIDTGDICNRRTIFDFAANNVTGYPDGMTTDTEDNLWIACYNGWKVIKVDTRSGRLLQVHKIPAEKVTSVSWGGPQLSTLYVTTSQRNVSPDKLSKQPQAGSIFAIENTGSKGLPANEFIFNIDY